jgi:hypothetical protein
MDSAKYINGEVVVWNFRNKLISFHIIDLKCQGLLITCPRFLSDSPTTQSVAKEKKQTVE